jgi:anti-sigma regulatory factor (Ser/Thr protein kinase)
MLDLAELFKSARNAADYKDLQDSRPITIDTPKEFEDVISLGVQGTQMSLEKFIVYLHSLDLPGKTEFELRTVFYEVLINIRDHSGLGESAHVQFSAKADKFGLRMVFQDEGRPFDPTKFVGTNDFIEAAQKRQFRGFGLMMISKMINEVQYSRTNDGYNQLTLLKRWRE